MYLDLWMSSPQALTAEEMALGIVKEDVLGQLQTCQVKFSPPRVWKIEASLDLKESTDSSDFAKLLVKIKCTLAH